ncbi:MAG: glycosyl transferase family 1 [Bacteroidetes bacterium]|nr:glycosyl transferase family 1 [Bacteroidota bacterium]
MRLTDQRLPLIFLEAHNIQNRNKGLGVFNFELLKALSATNTDFRLMANMSDRSLMTHFDSPLMLFHKYYGLHRKPLFRIRKRADIWHSLNQNTKIEPYHDLNYVLTIHDVIGLNGKGELRLLEKIKRAKAITYISKFVQQETHQAFEIPSGVMESVIYNGNPIGSLFDTSSYQAIEAAKSPFLYAIGDFQERKNFHSLIQMMRINKDFNLIISGQNKSDYALKIKNLIENYSLKDRVFLTGIVSEQGKQYYMSHASAFLFPSTEEGFGLPIIEAMHFGKPVFLSTATCIPEIGGQDAYYFENFDPERMHDKLMEGLHHFSQNEEEMEQKMKERASLFSWKKAAKEYLNVYQNVISGV